MTIELTEKQEAPLKSAITLLEVIRLNLIGRERRSHEELLWTISITDQQLEMAIDALNDFINELDEEEG